MITKELSENLQLDGANACAIGLSSKLDNPFYKPENMPAQTGESLEDWQAKAEAWNLGFEMDNSIRS